MKKHLLLLSLFVGAFTLSNAQSADQVRYCGHTQMQDKFFQHRPDCRHSAEGANQQLEDETRIYGEERGGGQTVYIIPMVFHVIHNGGVENISDQQIYDAVAVLNRDFRKLNADTKLDFFFLFIFFL